MTAPAIAPAIVCAVVVAVAAVTLAAATAALGHPLRDAVLVGASVAVVGVFAMVFTRDRGLL